jgi:hypothetical protein
VASIWWNSSLPWRTRLTLWTNIDRRFIRWCCRLALSSMFWIIFSGTPIGRIVGPEAMSSEVGSD